MNENRKVRIVNLVVKESDKGVLIPTDSVILLLYAMPNTPVRGRTVLHKELFLLYKEVLGKEEFKNIAVKDPDFVPYKFGPFSFKLSSALASLIFSGKVNKKGGRRSEKFTITEDGVKLAEEILKFLPDKLGSELLEELKEKRTSWDQLGRSGLLIRAEALFPEYFVLSVIWYKHSKEYELMEMIGKLNPGIKDAVIRVIEIERSDLSKEQQQENYWNDIQKKLGDEIWAKLYAE